MIRTPPIPVANVMVSPNTHQTHTGANTTSVMAINTNSVERT